MPNTLYESNFFVHWKLNEYSFVTPDDPPPGAERCGKARCKNWPITRN